ncbi:hypothetical protein [Rhizobium rhizogenes]|uniref:hypothetical protein n=1 Tax=Rhizobium rhizogenes TaxID=359 RepID=UPI0015727CF0|nr:hypothetical protein [Rhizobium rhizogenes]NTF65806.1 hypothetical protein [Rhizobium rhizogenes]NTG97102.1 hypothetical protein [Rhizobium rhizogenes]
MKIHLATLMAAVMAASSAHAGQSIQCMFPDKHLKSGFVPMDWYLVGDLLYQGRSKPKPDPDGLSDPMAGAHMKVTSRDGDIIRADWDRPGIGIYSNNFSVNLATGEAMESFMSGHQGRRHGICLVIDTGEEGDD